MKMTFKFSLLVLVLANIMFLSSCEENLQISCDDFSISISYEIDSSFVTLTAGPEGGEDPIAYQWSTGETTQSIDVTEVMTYSVTATDASDCTASLDFVVDTTTIIITEPCDSFYVDIVEIAVPAISVITAQVNGATGVTTFLWSNSETTQSIEVGAGTYTVVVTDEAGCTSTATYTVIQNSPCDSIAAYITEDFGSFSSYLSAFFTDGSGVETYSWSTGETNPTIEVGPGEYSVTITNSLGCVAEASYTVTQAGPCDNFIVTITEETNPVSGEITLVADVSGGTAPYTYEWQLDSLFISTDPEIISPIDGFYILIVTDSNGCNVATSIEINGVCFGFEVNISSFPDSTTNMVTLVASLTNPGTNPNYSWTTGEITQAIEVSNNSGSYSVTVVNDEGCEDEDTIQI